MSGPKGSLKLSIPENIGLELGEDLSKFGKMKRIKMQGS